MKYSKFPDLLASLDPTVSTIKSEKLGVKLVVHITFLYDGCGYLLQFNWDVDWIIK